MRILFLSTWFPFPPDNGSRIRAHYLLRALGRDHHVTLVTFRPASCNDRGYVPATGLDHLQIYPVPADPYRHVHASQIAKFLSPIPLAFWPSAQMRQAVKQVTHAGSWDAVVAFQMPVARYALQLPSVPRILDVDTSLGYQMYERYAGCGYRIARLRAWARWQKACRYESRLSRKFQACTIVSPAELGYVESMVKGTGCHVEVNFNGVDCRHNSPGLAQPAANTLVFNGALTYSANYDAMQRFLADTYPVIRQRVPDVSLTITGSNSDVDLGGLRLDDTVHLSGHVDDVRPLVAGAWACVVPIRQGGGTRIKILEAMALGTPVVATFKGAEGLDVTPDQDILIADDPPTFAAQVVRLLRDPALRKHLASNARRLVEKRYDWSAIGQRFTHLVETTAWAKSCS